MFKFEGMARFSLLEELVEKFRIKELPGDFCVTEILALSPEAAIGGNGYVYYRLKKAGYTTFQAIDMIARFFCIDRMDVSYCGLKDEDGITDQMIAVPSKKAPSDVIPFNRSVESEGRFIRLTPYGTYRDVLTIGGLEGNAFRIIVRRLPRSFVQYLEGQGSVLRTFFINYYDIQRFGTPNSPKTTHLIGGALLENDYHRAFELLRQANTPESKQANVFSGEAREFFKTLDPRVISFFMSAHSSFQWNKKVSDVLKEHLLDEELIRFEQESIPYTLPVAMGNISKLLGPFPTFEYHRYRFQDGEYTYSVIDRPTFYQIPIRINRISPDERHEGFDRIELSFSLPSGTYATNVVTQMILGLGLMQMENDQSTVGTYR